MSGTGFTQGNWPGRLHSGSRMKAKRTFCLSRHHHPSHHESEYCNWLYARKQNLEIKDYKLYPSVPLEINGKTFRIWKIDFQVMENDDTISYHEAKGWNRSDDSFRMKRDAFLICWPGIKLYVNKELYTGKTDKNRLRRIMEMMEKKRKMG